MESGIPKEKLDSESSTSTPRIDEKERKRQFLDKVNSGTIKRDIPKENLNNESSNVPPPIDTKELVHGYLEGPRNGTINTIIPGTTRNLKGIQKAPSSYVQVVNNTKVIIEIDEEGNVTKILQNPDFENVILKGAGMRGIAYIGMVEPLFERNIIQKTKRIIGTSAGSLMGMLLGYGLSFESIKSYTESVDFRQLVNTSTDNIELKALSNAINSAWKSLFTGETSLQEASKNPRLDDGEKLIKKIREVSAEIVCSIIKDKDFNDYVIEENKEKDTLVATFKDGYKINLKNITFKNMQELAKRRPKAGIKDLTITGVKVNEDSYGEITYFNAETEPDMEIALAVRISTSIPYFFKPVNYNGKYYIDGGCLDNFPIEYYDNVPCLQEGVIKHTGEFGQNLTNLNLRVDKEKDTVNLFFNRPAFTEEYETISYRAKSNIKPLVTHADSSKETRAADRSTHHKHSHNTFSSSDGGLGMAEFDAPRDKIDGVIAAAKKDTNIHLDLYQSHDGIMEMKKYSSFIEMCEDMEIEELEKFCKILESENAVIINSTTKVALSEKQKEYSGLAKAIYEKNKNIKNKNSKMFSNLISLLTIEMNEMNFHSRKTKTKTKKDIELFRIEYLNSILAMTDRLKYTNVDDRAKTELLLKWAYPAIKNTSAQASVLDFANKRGIDLADASSNYVQLLFDHKQKLYTLKKECITSKVSQTQEKIINEINAQQELINEAIKELAKSPNLTDEQATTFLKEKIAQRAPTNGKEEKEKEEFTKNNTSKSEQKLAAKKEIENETWFDIFIDQIRDELIGILDTLGNSEEKRNKFLNAKLLNIKNKLIAFIKDHYKEILLERDIWTYESLLMNFHTLFTVRDGVKEEQLIANWKRDAVKQLYSAFEKQMLIQAFQEEHNTLASGLEYLPFNFSLNKKDTISNENIVGWAVFEKNIDHFWDQFFAEGKDDSKGITLEFNDLIQKNIGAFIAIDDWEAVLVKLFGACITKHFDKRREHTKFAMYKADILIKQLCDDISTNIIKTFPQYANTKNIAKNKISKLAYEYELISTLHDLVTTTNGKYIKLRDDLLTINKDNYIGLFFKLILNYNREFNSTRHENQLRLINNNLKKLLDTLPPEESQINRYLHAYYYTFVKQNAKGELLINDDEIKKLNESDKICLQRHIYPLLNEAFPLSYYLSAQFSKKNKVELIKGAQLLCPQSEVTLAKDYFLYLENPKNEVYQFPVNCNEKSIIDGLKHALQLGNSQAIDCYERFKDIKETIKDPSADLKEFIEWAEVNHFSVNTYQTQINKLVENLKATQRFDEKLFDIHNNLLNLQASRRLGDGEKSYITVLISILEQKSINERIKNGRYDLNAVTEDFVNSFEPKINALKTIVDNRIRCIKRESINKIGDLLKEKYFDKRESNYGKFCNFLFRDSLLSPLKQLLAQAARELITKHRQRDTMSILNIIDRLEDLNLIIEELKDEKKIKFKKIPFTELYEQFTRYLQGQSFDSKYTNPAFVEKVALEVNEKLGYVENSNLTKLLTAINAKDANFKTRLEKNDPSGFGKKYRPLFSSELGNVISEIKQVALNRKNHEYRDPSSENKRSNLQRS